MTNIRAAEIVFSYSSQLFQNSMKHISRFRNKYFIENRKIDTNLSSATTHGIPMESLMVVSLKEYSIYMT